MRLGLGLQRGSRRLSSDPFSGIEGRVLDLRPDPSTMYVDASGTQPASVGDPVGRWEDQSGQDNHATQDTQSAKPTLSASGAAQSDGADDGLYCDSFAPARLDQITVLAHFVMHENNSYPRLFRIGNPEDTYPAWGIVFVGDDDLLFEGDTSTKETTYGRLDSVTQAGNEYTLAVRVDRGDFHIDVDEGRRTSVGTYDAGAGFGAAPARLEVLSFASQEQNLAATLKHFQVYDRTLSVEEMHQIESAMRAA